MTSFCNTLDGNVPVDTMKAPGGVGVQLYTFLTSALNGGKCLASCSFSFFCQGKGYLIFIN
jgi:hypothetical protein